MNKQLSRRQFFYLLLTPFLLAFARLFPVQKPKKTLRTKDKYGNILVGYRGSSLYDAGIFYCPYIPLQVL